MFTEIRMLKLKEVMAITALSRSAIYDKIAKGKFPAPAKLGDRSVAWIESEVQGWLTQRIAERKMKIHT